MDEEIITKTTEDVESEQVDTREETVSVAEMKRRLDKEKEKHQKELADLKSGIQREIEESKKLAKMNEDEKRHYEFEQLQKELADLKKEHAFYGLSKEASKMLSEHNIHADDELLAFVVKDDAEATKLAVDSFVALVNSKVTDGVKQALSGTPPKANVTNGGVAKNPFNKDTFNLTEQAKLLKENPELYKQLKAQAK